MVYERKIKYTTISISIPLMEKIQGHINKTKFNISVGDFMRDAAKEKMEREGTYMDPKEQALQDKHKALWGKTNRTDEDYKLIKEFLDFYTKKGLKRIEEKSKIQKQVMRKEGKKKK